MRFKKGYLTRCQTQNIIKEFCNYFPTKYCIGCLYRSPESLSSGSYIPKSNWKKMSDVLSG